MKHIETDFATLFYYPDKKIIHHQFHKAAQADDFRTILNAGVALMEEHNAIKLLSDDRNNSVLPDTDSDWAINDWAPRAIANGWRYWAVIVSTDFEAQWKINKQFENYSQQGIRVMTFADSDQAIAWLDTVDTRDEIK